MSKCDRCQCDVADDMTIETECGEEMCAECAATHNCDICDDASGWRS